MKISISDSFLDAMRALDPVDARRASAFAEKLIVAPEVSSLHPEIVHEARERAVRSLRVTQDMRAIAHLEDGRLLLLFVGRHDAAYAWARGHCIECIVRGDDLHVRLYPATADGASATTATADGRACIAETLDELRALLREYGIPLARG